MPYTVFFCYSVPCSGRRLIAEMCERLDASGITCHTADRDWKSGVVPAKVENAIRSADCVIAFLTTEGRYASHVNQEIGIARKHKKDVIVIVETGSDVKNVQVGPIHLEFDFYSAATFTLDLLGRTRRLLVDTGISDAIFWGVISMIGGFLLTRKS